MDTEKLRYFENLCDKLYGGSGGLDAQNAGEELSMITKNSSFIHDIRFILRFSQNRNALTCISLTMKHTIEENWSFLSDEERYGLRDLLIEFINTNNQHISPLVLSGFSSSIALISKLGWSSDRRYRNLLTTIESILEQKGEYTIVGLKLMSEFVECMNFAGNMDFTEHRKTATQFISETLLDIFQYSLTILNNIHANDIEYQDLQYRDRVLVVLLELISKCLQFDFLGYTSDDGSDEIWILQLPQIWEGLVCSPNQLQVLFDIYNQVQIQTTKSVLEVIMLLASIRRSLFRDGLSRLEFLCTLIDGVMGILQTGFGMNNEDTYNMMCQLLTRLKSNFQLSELMKTPHYSECFNLISNFTCTSLRNWNSCSNSITFLLTLWSRMTCANRYVTLTDSIKPNSLVLQNLIPDIVESYIIGRLNQVADENGVNPLDDPEGLQEELVQFPQMIRFHYNESGGKLYRRMQEEMQIYNELIKRLQGGEAVQEECHKSENKLALLVHIIANTLTGQSFMISQYRNGHTEIDSSLTQTVFMLLKQIRMLSQERQYRCDYHLELAFCSFFLLFRKTIINDEKTFAILREFDNSENPTKRALAFKDFIISAGFSNHFGVLEEIWDKVCENLRIWGDDEAVVSMSLKVMRDLTSGYEYSKLLLSLPPVINVLTNQTETMFPFLSNPSLSHLRTLYYESLTALTLLENIPGRLSQLLQPLMERVARLNGIERFGEQECYGIITVFRDLRGICNICTSKRDFNLFFEIIYPSVFNLMQKAIHQHPDQSEVVSSVLKCLAAIALNRESRIDYCNDLANGVVLFTASAKILLEYGSILLNNFPSFVNCSDIVYKGICQLFHVMERFLKGNCIPFGVFSIYKDNVLEKVLEIYMQIIIRTPFKQLSQLPKYEHAVFVFLELLFSDHLLTVTSIEKSAFITVMDSVCNGVTSFNSDVVRCSAHILDRVATYLYFNRGRSNAGQNPIINNFNTILQAQPNFWDVVIMSVLNGLLFGSSNTVWDLSRSLYPIHLLSPLSIERYLSQTMSNQSQGVITKLVNDTKILTSNLDYSLVDVARDEFSKKTVMWRKNVLSYVQL